MKAGKRGDFFPPPLPHAKNKQTNTESEEHFYRKTSDTTTSHKTFSYQNPLENRFPTPPTPKIHVKCPHRGTYVDVIMATSIILLNGFFLQYNSAVSCLLRLGLYGRKPSTPSRRFVRGKIVSCKEITQANRIFIRTLVSRHVIVRGPVRNAYQHTMFVPISIRGHPGGIPSFSSRRTPHLSPSRRFEHTIFYENRSG